MDTTMVQVATLILQIVLIPLAALLWRQGTRLTKLETLITNGMSRDLRHLKDNCPGCLMETKDHGRRLDRLEADDGSSKNHP